MKKNSRESKCDTLMPDVMFSFVRKEIEDNGEGSHLRER